MIGRNQGNAVAANRSLRVNLKRKSNSNYKYYAVGVGLKPGVYDNWDDCKAAVGDKKAQPRPQWSGFNDHKDAKNYCKSLQIAVRDSRRSERNRLQAAPQQPHQPIERQNERPATLEDALAVVGRKLGAHPALALGADAFANFFHLNRDDEARFVIYTHGAYFKSGPEYADSKAAAGVWFGEQSTLNCSVPSFNILRRSKNDVALLAALFALKIANLAGMQSVCIHSRSKFVVNRLTSVNFDGASHVLLDNLRRELQVVPQVTWVLSKQSEHGSKEAETLANNEAGRG